MKLFLLKKRYEHMGKVIHFKKDSYLPVTETWIYEQIKNLKRYKPIVDFLMRDII